MSFDILVLQVDRQSISLKITAEHAEQYSYIPMFYKKNVSMKHNRQLQQGSNANILQYVALLNKLI